METRMDQREFEHRAAAAAREHAAWVRRNLAQASAELEALIRGVADGSRPANRADELGEDGEVSVRTNRVDREDAGR